MPPPVTISSFENMQVMQRLLKKKRCVYVDNFLEVVQYIVVVVQNAKIFATLCPNDSSFESDRLLFSHIPSPGYPEQISPHFY